MIFLASLCAAYLMGSIPTGLLVGKLITGVDVRQRGSGNVGATNVVRVAGTLPGLFVLLVDVAKGWVPVTFISFFAATGGPFLSPQMIQIVLGVAAVFGHIWNPFLQFQGGKGVATSLGVLMGLDPHVGWGVFAVWILLAVFTRYVSVASIGAAVAAPFFMSFLGLPTSWILGSIAVSVSIISRHRPNLLRLLHGEEHRIGAPRKPF